MKSVARKSSSRLDCRGRYLVRMVCPIDGHTGGVPINPTQCTCRLVRRQLVKFTGDQNKELRKILAVATELERE